MMEVEEDRVWRVMRKLVLTGLFFVLAGVATGQETTREWEDFLVGRWRTVSSIRLGTNYPDDDSEVKAVSRPDNTTVVVYRDDGRAFFNHIENADNTGDGKVLWLWWVTPYGEAFRLTERHSMGDGTPFDMHSILGVMTRDRVLLLDLYDGYDGRVRGASVTERVK